MNISQPPARVTLRTKSLFAAFLFFLPFTQALTFNLFFPLKISEILLFTILLTEFARLNPRKLNTAYFKEFKLPLLFALVATLSCIVNLFWEYPYELSDASVRISNSWDSVLRLLYIYANFFAFYLAIKFIGDDISILRYWLYGALSAALYSWYLVSFSASHLPVILLPGMGAIPQTIDGVIIRCGTFKEGNFFGLYLALSSVIAFHLGRKRMGWFLLASVITSFSTTAVISAFVFFSYLILKMLSRRNTVFLSLIIFVFFSVFMFFFKTSDFFIRNVSNKLFDPMHTLTPDNFSKVDRYLSARTAFLQGVHNPILGVGPNNYALHKSCYCDLGAVLDNPPPNLTFCDANPSLHPIPNSVYFEVLAEYGFLGLFFFLLMLVKFYFMARKQKLFFISLGLLLCFFSLIAFPSFIMLFLWVYFAIPYAVKQNREKQVDQ